MLVVPVLNAEEFDPNSVTPGVWGFIITFLLMVVVVLLILDMVRRIRRTQYRAEVRAQLEAERLEREVFADDDTGAPDAPGAPGAPGARDERDEPAAPGDEDDGPPTR